MDQPIIVGIADEHEAADAVALAVDLGRALDAPIVLAGICIAVPGPAEVRHLEVMRTQINRRLEHARTLVPPDVNASVIVRVARSAMHGLHDLAEHRDAVALVLGPTHLGRVARAALGDVALTALHAAPCAVAVAPDGYATRRAPRLGTVGVGLVDTPEAHDALGVAVEVAAATGARVRIIHVEPDATASPYLDRVAGPRSDLEDRALEAERLLDAARARASERVTVETVMRRGDAAEELVAAGDQLDLLVLGSRGYGPVRRLLLGSVSGRVVHAAACPLLILSRAAHVEAEAGAHS